MRNFEEPEFHSISCRSLYKTFDCPGTLDWSIRNCRSDRLKITIEKKIICYGYLADNFFNLLFSMFKRPELLIEVSGTVELSCAGIELNFFHLLGFDLLTSQACDWSEGGRGLKISVNGFHIWIYVDKTWKKFQEVYSFSFKEKSQRNVDFSACYSVLLP